MESCPACERKFKGILEYPKVALKRVQRFDIDALEGLLALEADGFNGTQVSYCDPHPKFKETNLLKMPKPVRSSVVIQKVAPDWLQKLFEGKSDNFIGPVEHEGWQWVREKGEIMGSDTPQPNTQPSPQWPVVEGHHWWYERFKNAKPYFLSQVENLEKLTGTEVPRDAFKALLFKKPKFYLQTGPIQIRGPFGGWFVNFAEAGQRYSGMQLRDDKRFHELAVLKSGQARLDLCQSAGGTHGEYFALATLLVVDYEGLVNTPGKSE